MVFRRRAQLQLLEAAAKSTPPSVKEGNSVAGDDIEQAALGGNGTKSATAAGSYSSKEEPTSSLLSPWRWMLTAEGKIKFAGADDGRDEVGSEGSAASTRFNDMMVLFRYKYRRVLFSMMILLVGCGAAGAFYGLGISQANKSEAIFFQRKASDVAQSILEAWSDYELYGLWIHESCRPKSSRINGTICTREEFSQLVEYINSKGLKYQALEFMRNTSHDDRQQLEESSRQFYAQNYPHIDYTGMTGFVPSQDGSSLTLGPQPPAPYYFPVHYIEPIAGNERAIDLNTYSNPINKRIIDTAVETWKPALTGRLQLVQEKEEKAYSIILYHPGVRLSNFTDADIRPTSLSMIVIRVPALLERSAKHATGSNLFYIFDSTTSGESEFLGGARVYVSGDGNITKSALPETNLEDLLMGVQGQVETRVLEVADRKWTMVLINYEGHHSQTLYVIIGGTVILAATLVLAAIFFRYMGRVACEIAVETAKNQAESERQLNEYIAHEIRNPLSSAIAALSFTMAANKEEEITEKTKAIGRDLNIISASLNFINDLLRNMLDMKRAENKMIRISWAPVDILKDVLEPVAAVLYLRGNEVRTEIDCPENLVVLSDRLRLKQLVLNLSANSLKFVERGFIRLRAVVEEGSVILSCEDSGPGIPLEKQKNLFMHFQQSLDLQNQGTGIGLSLCKHLSILLHGDISLDGSFDSGVPGCKGTRFVLDLKRPPISAPHLDHDAKTAPQRDHDATHISRDSSMSSVTKQGSLCSSDLIPSDVNGSKNKTPLPSLRRLPDELNVLIVDDDMMVRKLFARAVLRAFPNWEVTEASSGEAALHLVESNCPFQLICIDQYMSSTERQLLGTETVRALRAQGTDCTICGLSANDRELAFIEAGADAFLLKPFPCEKAALTAELQRILFASSTSDGGQQQHYIDV